MGRDVLIVCTGHSIAALWGETPPPPSAQNLGLTAGLRPLVAWVLLAPARSLLDCLSLLVLLVALRVLLRRVAAALAAVALLFALAGGAFIGMTRLASGLRRHARRLTA